MPIGEQIFSGENDLDAMAELVHQFPAENLHVVDLPYRLSSWAFGFSDNVRLWRDEQDHLIAWAVLQIPFWTFDYAIHPEFQQELHPQILKWADAQAQKTVNTPSGHPSWFVAVRDDQIDRIRDLEQAGFESQADVGENSWSQVLVSHSMQIPNDINLPEGFQIRPLKGADEVAAYVNLHRAVFESKSMTVKWRKHTLERPEYIPDLDLVTVAPNNQLAAFCICWLARDGNGNTSGQIEPMGVHVDYRKLGLGGAILGEGLRRLSAKGATHIYVHTDNYRNAAFNLYTSSGFQVMHDILIYRKNYERNSRWADG